MRVKAVSMEFTLPTRVLSDVKNLKKKGMCEVQVNL